MKNIFFLILGLTLILGSIFLFLKQPIERGVKIIKINDTTIKVEVADTQELREQGLSGRKTLADGTGMLFIFDSPAMAGFWMKDMNFAIDIVWIDENYQIVDIDKSVLPETFPEVFYPDRAIKYVLEVPTGYTNQHQIGVGVMVQF